MTVGDYMLYDFIKIDRNIPIPAYRQLLDALRQAIEKDLLPAGHKALSIRKAAKELSLSRMTVETAYQQLCMEGYLVSRPQCGYFVANQITRPQRKETGRIILPSKVRFDFGSRRVDAAYADLRLWQKNMRAILSQEQVMTSYGDVQGEPALREALASYAFEARGVRADSDQIVIGAGIQPLLTMLCGLLCDKGNFAVGLEKPGFPQAEQVFTDYGLSVQHINKHAGDIPDDIDIYVHLPSRTGLDGFSREIERRNKIAAWRSVQPERYVLEDDYNGELRFLTRPLPALQGMDDGVIFLGSFSKLLLPSVRIAYMVLPETLAEKFRCKSRLYNQTASKVEQLALAEYIGQGQLEKHLRRLRRLYQKKSQEMERAFVRYMPDIIDMELWETELCYLIKMHSLLGANELTELAEKEGILLSAMGSSGQPQVMLSFAGIPLECIDEGIRLLAECWRQSI